MSPCCSPEKIYYEYTIVTSSHFYKASAVTAHTARASQKIYYEEFLIGQLASEVYRPPARAGIFVYLTDSYFVMGGVW